MTPDPSGITGAMIGPYRVLEKLGEGAMGRVYRAEDTRLGRAVALKLLPRELASEPGRRQRFQGEARLLASLNHPGIVTIHSVEEALLPEPGVAMSETFLAIREHCCGPDGRVLFFTMELVDGTSLDRVIPEAGLAVERFFALGIALTEALATAHEKGVTHRDLKPANVMVTGEDAVKVLDFGLARSGGVAPAEQGRLETEELDEEGLLVGTIPYMAPEQITGMAVDQRADVFALGIVLFEMASGSRPFEGKSPAERISAILRDAPRRLAEVRTDYPLEVGRLIERCLAKDPKLRPQTARDVRNQLAEVSVSSAPGAERVRAIAVLAFADMSAEKDQEYFCEGLAEELINALNRLEGLRVASRTSSFQFRGTGLDIREIGGRLNVDAVLEGSVRKSGERLRVTAELVGVADGFALWTGRFDRRMEDVFAIQEEIAGSIVDALEVTLSADERRRIGRASTRVVDAYDLYLRGRKYFYQYSRHGMDFALELFDRAVELDPEFARAHAGIADCHSYLYANAERSEEHLTRALDAASRALELDPEAAEAHVALATALSSSGRMKEAGESFETAIRSNPRLFEAHYFYARHLFVEGRADEAMFHYQRAGELRPDDYQGPLLSAQIYDDVGQQREAARIRHRGIHLAEERLKLRPDDTRALYMAANALVTIGEKERGLAWARRARELDPEEPMLLYNLGCIYSLAGEVAEALDCLESCLDGGFTHRGWFEHDSNLDAVRAHPRYGSLIERFDAAEPLS